MSFGFGFRIPFDTFVSFGFRIPFNIFFMSRSTPESNTLIVKNVLHLIDFNFDTFTGLFEWNE